MDKSTLQAIQGLLHFFTRDQRTKVKRWIPLFQSNHNQEESQQIELVNRLLDKSKSDIDRVRKYFVDKSSESNLFYLQRATIEKLLEFLTFGAFVNHKRKGKHHFSLAFRSRMEAKRFIQQAIMAATVGEAGIAQRRLKKVVELGTEYELYQEAAEALRYQLEQAVERTDHADFEALSVQLAAMEGKHLAYSQAHQLYFEYFSRIAQSGINKDNLVFLITHLKELEGLVRSSKSASVGFFYHNLLGEYHDASQNPVLAQQAYMEVIRLVESSPALNMPAKRADGYYRLAYVLLNTCQAQAAAQYCEKAAALFAAGFAGYRWSYETWAISMLYLGKTSTAKDYLEIASARTDGEFFSFDCARRKYELACIDLINGEYLSCFAKLQETGPLAEDKEGWNIGIKVLTIMNQIESGKLDLAAYNIEALRKYVTRWKDKVRIRDRELYIYKVFANLKGAGFVWADAIVRLQPLLKKLRDTEIGLRWEPNSYELIPIHLWVEAHCESKSYCFKLWPEYTQWQKVQYLEAELSGAI